MKERYGGNDNAKFRYEKGHAWYIIILCKQLHCQTINILIFLYRPFHYIFYFIFYMKMLIVKH